MSSRIITELLDDLDGSVATETVTFGLDGKTYTVDLSEINAHTLRESLSRYIAVAQVERGVNKPSTSKPRAKANGQSTLDRTAVRVWARDNGYDVGDRGRISQEIISKYIASTQAQTHQEPLAAAFTG